MRLTVFLVSIVVGALISARVLGFVELAELRMGSSGAPVGNTDFYKQIKTRDD